MRSRQGLRHWRARAGSARRSSTLRVHYTGCKDWYARVMVRWQPDARGRLAEAAMTLFFERGYDEVTVADIAERAGLTKRSFFNHFAYKREVVFAGGDALQEGVLAALAEADSDLSPLDAAVRAFT